MVVLNLICNSYLKGIIQIAVGFLALMLIEVQLTHLALDLNCLEKNDLRLNVNDICPLSRTQGHKLIEKYVCLNRQNESRQTLITSRRLIYQSTCKYST